MKKKHIFIIMTIFIFIMIFYAVTSTVSVQALSESFESAQNFVGSGKSDLINYDNLYQTVNFLYNIAMAIGIIIAVIVGIVLGIRIIFGSLDERADAKHLVVPYLIIVAILAFGFSIWKIIIGIIYKNI